MDQDLADAYAERDFRQLHKRRTWSIRDQADENAWTRHDNDEDLGGEYLFHGMPYAICVICEYLRKKETDARN